MRYLIDGFDFTELRSMSVGATAEDPDAIREWLGEQGIDSDAVAEEAFKAAEVVAAAIEAGLDLELALYGTWGSAFEIGILVERLRVSRLNKEG